MRLRQPPFVIHLTYLFLGNRFFAGLGVIVMLGVVSFWYAALFWPTVVLLVGLLSATAYDALLLYRAARGFSAVRQPPKVFSLGDELTVRLLLENTAPRALSLVVTDELPYQLQQRDHALPLQIGAGEQRIVEYMVRPTSRGEYAFGSLNVFLMTRWRLAERRLEVPQAQTVAVYPSIVQMKRFSLRARETVLAGGQRRPRPVTKSYEFDQIKEYVRGDDLRSVNWRATARRGELMVNKYVVERAQRIYCVIDKSRTMLMPFGGLSLLDYAINASLALSNVILRRDDRAGLLTFSDKLGDVLTADNKPDQLSRILETLYRQEEREGESDYELLYYATRRFLPGRSLLILFTNFESNYALDRVLPTLRRIGRNHVLVIVLFENTEIADLLEGATAGVEDVYLKSTARRYLQERQLMAARLRQNGLKVVLTAPEELTGSVISKYLEVKAGGSI